MDVIEDRSVSQDVRQDIYRISTGEAFQTLEELQSWYNNFEHNRLSQVGSESHNNRYNNGRTTPPPSYETLFPCSDNILSCTSLQKHV